MEGGPQEADRVDELEYEVSWAASLGSQPQAGCLRPSSGLAPAAPPHPHPRGGWASRPFPAWSPLLRLKRQVGPSRGGHG